MSEQEEAMAVATAEQHKELVDSGLELLPPAQLDLIRRTIGPDLTNDELYLFGHVAAKRRLDPFSNQLTPIKRRRKARRFDAEHGYEREVWEDYMVIQTRIDGFRVIAERTGKYLGQVGPEWYDARTGEWRDLWTPQECMKCGGKGYRLEKIDGVEKQRNCAECDGKGRKMYPPYAARVGAMREGFSEPIWGVALMDIYKASGPFWKMPKCIHQIAKCAEALALRRAFPEDLGGLYTDDEMAQADTVAAPAVPDGPPMRSLLPPEEGGEIQTGEITVKPKPEKGATEGGEVATGEHQAQDLYPDPEFGPCPACGGGALTKEDCEECGGSGEVPKPQITEDDTPY